MTPGQQFTLSVLKIVVPALTYLIGLHQKQPAYMVKKDTKEEG